MGKIEKPTSDHSDRTERIEKIITLSEVNIERVDTAGFHGTRIHSMRGCIDSGVLSGGVIEDSSHQYRYGDIFIYPFDESRQRENRKQIIEDTAGYAKMVARRHYILELLRLDFDNPKHHFLAEELMELKNVKWSNEELARALDDFAALRLGRKKNKEDVERLRLEVESAVKGAGEIRGFVFALHPRVAVDFEQQPGDPGEKDVRISCPRGLSLEYISGIAPQGEQEKEYIQSLKNQLQGQRIESQ